MGAMGTVGPSISQWRGARARPRCRDLAESEGRSPEAVTKRREGAVVGQPTLPVPSEQVLHLWLEVLCSSLPTVEKWYQPWSFLRSPGWVQIKCELR